MLLEMSGGITPERMKGWSQSKNNTQLWMGMVLEARFDAVKSNIAEEPGMLGPWLKVHWKWSNRRWQERTSSWTIEKAEHRRIDAFELWCWRRLLRVPWTARRSNQSILKEISPGCSLEGPMLKLKFQYFGHLMWKAPDAGRDWGQEEKGTTEDEMVGWHHQLNGHELSKLRELVMGREAWRAVVHGVTKSRTRLSDWTELSLYLGQAFCRAKFSSFWECSQWVSLREAPRTYQSSLLAYLP